MNAQRGISRSQDARADRVTLLATRSKPVQKIKKEEPESRMFDSTVPPAQPSRARRMLGRLALAALVMLASFIVASLPAAASHLKGGYITAKIDSTTNHITGRYTYINDDNDPLGQTDTFTIDITPPAGQPDGPKTFNVTGEVVFTAPGTSVYAAQYDVDLTTVFPGGVPDGVYTLYFSDSATVSGIVNGNPGGDTGSFYRAQVTKGPGQLGSPEITCDPPLFIPIGYNYFVNLLVTPQQGQTFTYTELLDTSPGFVAGDDVWSTSSVITLDQQGNISIDAATTAGYALNSYRQFYVRVSKTNGDFSDIFIVMTATNNAPPSLVNAPTLPVSVAAAGSQTTAIQGTDPDGGDTVTLLLRNAPAWVTLANNTPGNPATANLSFNPPANTTAGTYQFTVRALDSGGLYVDQLVTVNVQPAQTDENVNIQQTVTPAISSGGPGATVPAGQALIPNTSTNPYQLTNVRIGFTNPEFIASASMFVTAGGVTQTVTVSDVSALTDFPITPSLTIPANTQAQVTLNLTLASNLAAMPAIGGPSADRLVPTFALNASSSNTVAGLVALLVMALLGLAAVCKPSFVLRPQFAMMVCAVVLSTGLYGCGSETVVGGSKVSVPTIGGASGAVISVQLLKVDATDPSLKVINFTNLPASLGTVQYTQI